MGHGMIFRSCLISGHRVWGIFRSDMSCVHCRAEPPACWEPGLIERLAVAWFWLNIGARLWLRSIARKIGQKIGQH